MEEQKTTTVLSSHPPETTDPAAKKPRAPRGSKQRTGSPNRPSWVDELSQTPLIDEQARQLESFLQAMADGKIDEAEVKAQEARVVQLLKDIDPQLDDTLHAQVTQLLCELTAYDIMQMLYALEQARPKTTFHG